MPETVAAISSAWATFSAVAAKFAYNVAIAVGATAKTAGVIAAATSSAIAALPGIVANVGLQVGLAYLLRPNLPSAAELQLPQKDSYPPRRSSIGRVRGSGYYMLFDVGNDGGAVSCDVIAFHDGEIDGIEQYWLFDDEVTLRTGNWVNELDGGAYRDDRVLFLTTTGQAIETAFAEFVTALPGVWTADHRGDGVAAIGLRCTQASEKKQSERFPKGLPQPSVTYRAQALFDPRDDSTAWSENPVLGLLGYLTTLSGGMGLDYARRFAAAESYWEAAADVCEEQIDLAAGGTEDRYRCGGTYLHTTPPSEVIGAILASFDGWLGQRGDGSLIVRAGKYEPPTVTFGDDEIFAYQLDHYQPDEESVNVLTVSFTDPDSKFATVDAGAWRNEAEITAQGRERSQPLDLPWVPSGSQARRLAKRAMWRLSAPLRGTVTVGLIGLNGLGERYLRLQISENDLLANIVVEVVDVEIDLAAMGVTFKWVQASEDIDDWSTAEETTGSEINPSPDPVELDPPTITSALAFYEVSGDGTTQPRITVDTETTGPTTDLEWDIRWRPSSSSSWIELHFTDPDDSPATLVTGFVPQDETIEVQTRFSTASRSSDWSASAFVATPVVDPFALLDEYSGPLLDEDSAQLLDEDAP